MNDNNWKLDLFSALDKAYSVNHAVNVALDIVRPLGFSFCGWRTNDVVPYQQDVNPHIVAFNTTADEALANMTKGIYDQAPVPRHCAASKAPITWHGTMDEAVFLQSPGLWEEYYAMGRRSGWAVATLESDGRKGIFFVESQENLSPNDMKHIERHLQWVSAATHIRINELNLMANLKLSPIELEVLKNLFKYDASLTKVLDNNKMNKHDIVNVVHGLKIKLGCDNLHSLVAYAVFLGVIG